LTFVGILESDFGASHNVWSAARLQGECRPFVQPRGHAMPEGEDVRFRTGNTLFDIFVQLEQLKMVTFAQF